MSLTIEETPKIPLELVQGTAGSWVGSQPLVKSSIDLEDHGRVAGADQEDFHTNA
jgi:hypothetical protein